MADAGHILAPTTGLGLIEHGSARANHAFDRKEQVAALSDCRRVLAEHPDFPDVKMAIR